MLAAFLERSMRWFILFVVGLGSLLAVAFWPKAAGDETGPDPKVPQDKIRFQLKEIQFINMLKEMDSQSFQSTLMKVFRVQLHWIKERGFWMLYRLSKRGWF